MDILPAGWLILVGYNGQLFSDKPATFDSPLFENSNTRTASIMFATELVMKPEMQHATNLSDKQERIATLTAASAVGCGPQRG